MKKFLFTVAAVIFAATLDTQAQKELSKSSEPLASRDFATGEAIIMPVSLHPDAPKLAAAAKLGIRTARLRNRAQMRALKADSTRNGYYPAMGNRDWGTSMRMNHYFFLPSVNTVGQ